MPLSVEREEPKDMRILYLTHSCPYPPNKGDRIRNFHILRHLSNNHQVVLVYPSFDPNEEKYLGVLRQWCVSVKTIQLSPLMAKNAMWVEYSEGEATDNLLFL